MMLTMIACDQCVGGAGFFGRETQNQQPGARRKLRVFLPCRNFGQHTNRQQLKENRKRVRQRREQLVRYGFGFQRRN